MIANPATSVARSQPRPRCGAWRRAAEPADSSDGGEVDMRYNGADEPTVSTDSSIVVAAAAVCQLSGRAETTRTGRQRWCWPTLGNLGLDVTDTDPRAVCRIGGRLG